MTFDEDYLARIQIDKVCEMALDEEACDAYRVSALKIIQAINASTIKGRQP